MADLSVAARLTTPYGWLDLNSGAYRLTAEAFGEESVTWRRQDVTNPFVEGTWTVSAVRENVEETLSVWVKTASWQETASAVETLRQALYQLNYGLEVTFEGLTRYYTCYVSDVVVTADGPMRVSRLAKVVAQIPRHPVFTETPQGSLDDPLTILDGGTPASVYGPVFVDAGSV